MSPSHLVILFTLALLAICVRPVGGYMARVYMGEPVWLEKPLGWLERLIYYLCGVDPAQEMGWRGYATAVLLLGWLGFLLLFAILAGQGALPLNPQGYPGLSPDTAFNAAMSFVTNTNWQSYAGESSLSYFSQSVGLTVQNFFAPATCMAVAVAMFRGMARRESATLGNPYVDIVRGILYILLPASLLLAVLLASQGVVQSYGDYVTYHPMEKIEDAVAAAEERQSALIPLGPVASQEAIKMLGSGGGGFFNANSAHPFENPTPLSNWLELFSVLLLPLAMIYTFGVMVGDRRQGWPLLAALFIILVPVLSVALVAEQMANPYLPAGLVDQSAGNMEGKELRIGVSESVFWATAASSINGSANATHGSFMPLAGMGPLSFIVLGEVVFGGVGSGVYNMLVYVLLAVFVGGLMVGRTPEYLGKRLGPFEIKMATFCVFIPAFLLLLGTALAVLTEAGRAGVLNRGAQGFSEILYAVSSAANTNGSAFAGIAAGTPFYNVLLGVLMWGGRDLVILPMLALAGSMAAEKTAPAGAGTLSTHTPLFTALLVGSILLLDVLTYVPALALGPVAEHMHLHSSGYVP